MQQNDSLADGYRNLSNAFALDRRWLAVGGTVILLHPSLPLVGVSIVVERERQQNDSLVRG